MKCLIAIFILLLPLFCGSADFVSHSDTDQNFALRRLLRYVNKHFKITGRSADIDISCDETVPPGEPRVGGKPGKMTIVLNPHDDWQRDSGFARKLITLFLRAKTGNRSGNLSGIPDWFICGISQIASEQTGSARFIRNQHSFPLLSMLAENDFFGNPADVLEVEMNKLTGEERLFFHEYSKLIILTLEKMRFFTKVSFQISDSEKIDRKQFNTAAFDMLKNLNEKTISPVYRRILWSNFVPPPEKFTLRCLEYAFVSDVPELDKQGVPTGKMLKIHIEDFPSLTHRHDFLHLCRGVSAKLYSVSIGESREVRKGLADLRRILEEDIRRLAEEQENTDASAQQNKLPSVSAAPKKAAPRGKAQSDADVVKKSQNSDLRNEVGRYYSQRVISEKRSGSTVKVISGINRIFSSGITINPDLIKKYTAEITAAVERRKMIREYLDNIERERKAFPLQIENRKKRVRCGDAPQLLWLETVSKELY